MKITEYFENNFDWCLITLAFLIGGVTESLKLKWYWEIIAWFIPLLIINVLLNIWKSNRK